MYRTKILCVSVLNEQQIVLIARCVTGLCKEKEKCHEDVKEFFENFSICNEPNFFEDWDMDDDEEHEENPFFIQLRVNNQEYVELSDCHIDFIKRLKYELAVQNYITYDSMLAKIRQKFLELFSLQNPQTFSKK